MLLVLQRKKCVLASFMALPPHSPAFSNIWWIKKAELAETSLEVVKKSYEGNADTTSFRAVWGKHTEICPGSMYTHFCSLV